MADTPFALAGGEKILLEARSCHFVDPARPHEAALCTATLTDRRLLLHQAYYDVINACERDGPTRILHDIPLRRIASAQAELMSAEPSLCLQLTPEKGAARRIELCLRDAGWHLGDPRRARELESWRALVAAGLDIATTAPEAGPRAAASAQPSTQPDEQLIGGRYKVGKRIGEGGMALVFRGTDCQLDRPVAVKRTRPEYNLTARDREAFLREARTSASLHHPFIVEIYEIVEVGERDVCLVFEFVEGETIADLLDRKGVMDPREVKWALKDICAALSYAHSCRIAHRDLKPSNIMLTPHGHAKVMDFGIARQMKDTVSHLHTIEASGTAAYMAPEQELGKFNARSDLYSLGAMAYQMLTGDLPFYGPDFFAQKEAMSWKPLAQAASEVPAELAGAVERCLRFDPAARFSSIEEFARAAGVPDAA